MIEDFPGDFFLFLNNQNYIKQYNLLIFKEDIGKLSGFIGYGPNDITVICINYKRSLGHQNFTLAHEIGHWFLHKGQNISDDNVSFYSSDKIEQEASSFAIELLYPNKEFIKDYDYIINNKLLSYTNRSELGKYVDSLCHKYCLSFELILRKILYKCKAASKYKSIRKEIEISLGGKISEVFEKDFYVANENLPQYQQLKTPYDELKKRINYLLANDKIGPATAESILMRNGIHNS